MLGLELMFDTGIGVRVKVKGKLRKPTCIALIMSYSSLGVHVTVTRQKLHCRRTAPVEQFAGYSKTDHHLRTV